MSKKPKALNTSPTAPKAKCRQDACTTTKASRVAKSPSSWYHHLNPLDTTNSNHHLISLIFLAATAVLVSINTLWGEFVYDDTMTILEDKRICDWHQIFYWTPRHIRTITYIIDYQLWGLNPFGFHLTNLILHAACCLLLYCLINLIFKKPMIALFCSLLFSVHPVHSEAVSVISHRKDLLAMMFYCLAFILYLRGIATSWQTRPVGANLCVRPELSEQTHKEGRHIGLPLRLRLRYTRVMLLIASVVSYFLAMFSKEVAAVGLPVMICLYHFLFEPSKTISTLKKYWPYLLAGFVLIAAFFIKLDVLSRASSPRNILMVTNNATSEYLPVLCTMLKSFLTYLRLLSFPCNLFMNYEVPISMSLFEPGVIAGALVLTALITFWIATYRRLPGVSFAIAWFLVGWLPTSNILPLVQFFVAERFMYIPSVGFCLLLAIGLNHLSQQRRKTAIALLAIIIAVYTPLTIKRNADWNNMYSLRFDWCQKVLARDPNSTDAHFRLGAIYSARKQHEQAISEFKQVIKLSPNHIEACNYLAIEYQDAGQYEPALEMYKKLLDIVPYPAKIHSNIGILYEKQGLYDQAIPEYKIAISLDPGLVTSYNNLGLIYEKQKQYDLAISQYQKSITTDKTYSKGYENLARIYASLGKITTAIPFAEKAVNLSPSAFNHANLSCLYYKNGQLKEAEKEVRTALGLEPSNKTYPLILRKIQQP